MKNIRYRAPVRRPTGRLISDAAVNVKFIDRLSALERNDRYLDTLPRIVEASDQFSVRGDGGFFCNLVRELLRFASVNRRFPQCPLARSVGFINDPICRLVKLLERKPTLDRLIA